MRTINGWLARVAVIAGLAMNVSATQAVAGTAVATGEPVRIVALGDSLTAGYLLPPNEAFPVQLAAALKARGHNVDIINAGVSGDTTSGGLERVEWSVPEGTDAVILELGANDALRGIDPALARKNLDAILAKLKASNVEILIAGMIAPNNWGAEYATAFNGMYKDLSAKHGTLLYPFFLDGLEARPDLIQSDGLHPTGKGVAMIVGRILPSAEQLLERVAAKRKAAVKN